MGEITPNKQFLSQNGLSQNGLSRVPGPFDFDNPDAQPSVQEDSSGDDWQCVDTPSSSMPDGSLWAVGFERCVDGAVHVVNEEYFSASRFDGAKQGFVFRSGVNGLGYYQDRIECVCV